MQNNSDHLAGGAGGGVQWQALPAGSTKALHQARAALLGPVADGLSRRAAVDNIDQVLATPAPKGDAKDAERLDALEAMVRNSQPCGINIGLHGDGNIYIYLDISRTHAAPRRATLREAIDAILASKGGAA